ncbi:MAG: Hsp20/alpha crystallin family protein [Saprospiraceae bacterium]|nr:Hsp20/alpha crystallin family protein [Saprospiraceae bacterium]
MTLLKRNSLFPTVPQLFDNFFTRDLFDWENRNHSFTNTTLPTVNIVENNDEFSVQMAAPGMSKKDFCVELNNEILTITSQKENLDELKEGERYTRREFSYQSFRRSFNLPKTVVDESKIKASYENGILRVIIPKKEEAKSLPPKQIAIA